MFLHYIYNYIYDKQDNVSWLHIELFSNVLLFLKIYALFLKDKEIRFGHIDFYFVWKFENR